jgi:hypothetical protein
MEGRGRLSSLDLLPDEAQEDLVWACQELYARARSQADILFELNDKLAVKGIEPISRSAFNRKALRLAASMRRMQETKQIFEALSGQLQPEKLDDHSVALGEFLKQLIFDLLQPGAGDHDADSAMKLGRAFRDVLAGQKISGDRRLALQKEFAAKAAKAIDQIAADEAGASGLPAAPDRAALLKRVREEIYGIMAP